MTFSFLSKLFLIQFIWKFGNITTWTKCDLILDSITASY